MWEQDFKLAIMMLLSRNLDLHNGKLNRKSVPITRKMLFCGWNLLYFEINGMMNP